MLTEFLAEELIKVPVEGEDKEEVFEELLSLLLAAGRIKDYDAALDAIIEREEQQTTGIGEGLAVPHGRIDSMQGAVGALGISYEGITHLSQLRNPGEKRIDQRMTWMPRCRVYRQSRRLVHNDKVLILIDNV